MIDYLNFWWHSSNEHGVHSPYVFGFLTRGLYGLRKKYRAKGTRSHRLALSTIDYFSLSNIYCTDSFLVSKIEKMFPAVIMNGAGLYDIMILEPADEIQFENSHKDTIFLILQPERETVRAYLNSNRFNLVVDFYYGLFLQNRTEQRRQNFILRY